LRRARIGEILVQRGLITERQLLEALERHREEGRPVGEVLVSMGYVGRSDLGRALADQQGVEFVDLKENPPDPEVARRVPEALARGHLVMAVREEEDGVLLACADPRDVVGIDLAKAALGVPVRVGFAFEQDIREAITRIYGIELASEAYGEAAAPPLPPVVVSESDLVDSEQGAVRVLNAIFEEIVRSRPTDIHLEPGISSVRLRMRVDGLLRDVASLPHPLAASVISRLKALAGMDVAERRRPQDGRVTVSIVGEPVELRVATVGTQLGERAAVRVLSMRVWEAGLRDLGMFPEQEGAVRRALEEQHGMILITGPVGSGKTTTLYAVLRLLSDPGRCTVTVEDPVEGHLEGVSQIQVNEKAGITFEAALSGVLRHDPDVVAVGEIRDPDTARLVARAALTGHHQVLATMHASDVRDAVMRLLEMGVQPWVLAVALKLVINQRLVRKLCTVCRAPSAGGPGPYRAVGCSECGGTGYRGRIGVFEVLPVSAEVRSLIASGRALDVRGPGLWEAVRRRIADGITDEAEARRVLGRPPEPGGGNGELGADTRTVRDKADGEVRDGQKSEAAPYLYR
jgi:type IV pilus assembly protein PilB